MTDLNVDDFFRDSGVVLSRLYSAFPRPVAVYVEDVCGPEEPDEFGLHSERFLACFSTLTWLAHEGFLRYVDSVRQEAVEQAVLTAGAFTVLSVPARYHEPQDVTNLPDLVRAEHATNIHRLRTALKSQSSARIRAAMLDIMQVMPGSIRHQR